uniref:EndoU domain-containing protein n=1 Tax=Hyaloperonospora arabidopsidis (strain Emoy2) TaxID=559515 RepID=M4BMD6_HYAAE
MSHVTRSSRLWTRACLSARRTSCCLSCWTITSARWLVKNKKVTGDLRDFKKTLEFLWFGLYRREVYNEERHGRIDYKGYIRPRQRGCRFMEPHNKEQLITFQFEWEDNMKPVSTSLIGVSPEFEMALYTLCFLNGQENNPVQLGPYLCNIKCFSFGRGKDTRIGTAFPEALPLTEAQAAIKIQAVIRGSRTRILNPIVRRQAPPPPLGAAWGPLPGVVTTSIVHVEVRSSAVTSYLVLQHLLVRSLRVLGLSHANGNLLLSVLMGYLAEDVPVVQSRMFETEQLAQM